MEEKKSVASMDAVAISSKGVAEGRNNGSVHDYNMDPVEKISSFLWLVGGEHGGKERYVIHK